MKIFKRKSLIVAISFAFILFYIISPYVITNKIHDAIIKKDISTFSLFVNEDELKKNTKNVLLRELQNKIPDSVIDNKATKYLAEKALESSLNKFLSPVYIVNMLSNTMYGSKEIKIKADYEYNIFAPNTFIWNIKYENSDYDFQVFLKRHYLFLWKIEKIDFKVSDF